MNLAYTMAPGRGDTDQLLLRVAEALMSGGHTPCGTVQINSDAGEGPCDMDVRVLPDGPMVRISQSLGPAAKGCRLDPAALETAVGLVAGRLAQGADLLIVNKFGKHEADGRGFRSVIADAIALDIPVLVGVNALNLTAFQTFTDGQAQSLEPDVNAVLAWCDTVLGAQRNVA